MRILQHKVCCKVSHQNRVASFNCFSLPHIPHTQDIKCSILGKEMELSMYRIAPSYTKALQNQWLYSLKASEQERCPFEYEVVSILKAGTARYTFMHQPQHETASYWELLYILSTL